MESFFLGVSAVSPVVNHWRKKEPAPFFSKPKQDKRVLQFALQKIQDSSLHRGSLWASIQTPHLILDLLPFQCKTKKKKEERREQELVLSPIGDFSEYHGRPIGIASPHYNGWICAFLQFVLFIPSLYEMFPFLPKSLSPFLDFFAGYRKAQQEEKKMVPLDPKMVVEALRKKFPSWFYARGREPMNLYDLLDKVMNTLGVLGKETKSNLLAVRPFCRFCVSQKVLQKGSLTEVLYPYGKWKTLPSELLIGYQRDKSPEGGFDWQEVLYTSQERYSLYAFIEYRPEEGREKGDYITYVFYQGVWLQCYYQHILSVKQVNLPLALEKAMLLYYRR